jgi:hypothetical protein
MNLREVIDHVRGPKDLVLDKPLRPCQPDDFNEFLQVLQSSESIQTIKCTSQLVLEITEDQWDLLVKALGRIKGLQTLRLHKVHGSRDFESFQAVADAVNNAQSLRTLSISIDARSFPRDPSEMLALANALGEHKTLQTFVWRESRKPLVRQTDEAQITALDSVLRALPTCPHLRKVTIMTKCASADAIKHLLHLHSATMLDLELGKEDWLAVADEIRRGHCNVRYLHLSMLRGAESDATEAVKAVASAIRRNCNLNHLHLQMQNGFTDEAGVALAEALTVNTTLRKISLSATVYNIRNEHNEARLGAESYEAFASMLRVNTSLDFRHPPVASDIANERLVNHYNQMVIEIWLNTAGRGKLLSSSQTPREEWVDALHELSSYYVSSGEITSALRLSCLYSLLQLNPAVVA